MKIFKNWMYVAILFCGIMTFASCTVEDDAIYDDPISLEARVTSSVHVDEKNLTVFNFEYPSTDPFGKPTLLSGSIVVGDQVTPDAPGAGLLLYNHYTVYRYDQCPSLGNLDVELLMAGSGLITISADYYGFGVTGDKPQAYCLSKANAQASVDALINAKKLLKDMGYSWNDDILFNAGYSQGGQTAMAVVRLIDEKYPDLHLTHTFAGGGSYDIPATYTSFISSGISGMPSTVISVLLAYNHFYNLNIPRSELFIDPVLSNIDEWVLSKKYTREEIDQKIGSLSIEQFAAPDMLDFNSPTSQKMMQALDDDNLCKGWTPRKDEHITLVHHLKDTTVPAVNTVNMAKFLQEQGVEDLKVMVGDFGTLGTYPEHESGAIILATAALAKVTEVLGISIWFNIFELL
ncbi:MAG: hypothetical protein K5683_04255 [Prevotella sp.]|nr:hypothetical protein [Prevotella sp.]